MIDKSSLLKSQGSLYLEFIPKDGLFHKMLLLSLMAFLTGWCNLEPVLENMNLSYLPQNHSSMTRLKQFVNRCQMYDTTESWLPNVIPSLRYRVQTINF